MVFLRGIKIACFL